MNIREYSPKKACCRHAPWSKLGVSARVSPESMPGGRTRRVRPEGTLRGRARRGRPEGAPGEHARRGARGPIHVPVCLYSFVSTWFLSVFIICFLFILLSMSFIFYFSFFTFYTMFICIFHVTPFLDRIAFYLFI